MFSSLRVMGRATQGVRLINLRKNDLIASVAQVPKSEDEDYQTTSEEGDEIIKRMILFYFILQLILKS